MTKRRMKPAKVRRRKNPMRLPLTKPTSNKFSFDGTNLHATIFITAGSTTTNLGSDFQEISTDQAFSPSRVMSAMVRQYREYRYRKIVCHWIPSVGPAVADAGSRVHLAYSQNPEHIVGFEGAVAPFNSAANRVAFVKGQRNVFSFNAWERVSWNVPLQPYRRPWFDVNTIQAAIDANTADRSIQGVIVQAYESVSDAFASLGTMKIVFDLELRGLNVNSTAVV